MEYRWIYNPQEKRFILWDGPQGHEEKSEEVFGLEASYDQHGWNTWWGGDISPGHWSNAGENPGRKMVYFDWRWHVDYAPFKVVQPKPGSPYTGTQMKEQMPPELKAKLDAKVQELNEGKIAKTAAQVVKMTPTTIWNTGDDLVPFCYWNGTLYVMPDGYHNEIIEQLAENDLSVWHTDPSQIAFGWANRTKQTATIISGAGWQINEKSKVKDEAKRAMEEALREGQI
jgi:hypothetical protein